MWQARRSPVYLKIIFLRWTNLSFADSRAFNVFQIKVLIDSFNAVKEDDDGKEEEEEEKSETFSGFWIYILCPA